MHVLRLIYCIYVLYVFNGNYCVRENLTFILLVRCINVPYLYNWYTQQQQETTTATAYNSNNRQTE